VIRDWSTFLKHKFFSPGGAQRAANIAGVPAGTDAPPDQRVNAAIRTLVDYYTTAYGGGGDEKARQINGFTRFADDMSLLAGLTADPDVMELALKKLRNFA
jgi:hypothetical protein